MRAHRLLAAVAACAAFASPAAAFKAGLVLDVGGRGDKSFNDAAYRGLDRAKRELGVEYDYVEPAHAADRADALRQFASGPYGLIVGVGFIFTDDVNRAAKDFPGKAFACVDYAVSPGRAVPPNVVALKFREEEASFLGGVLAALSSKTKVIGFVGGMKGPLIRKFEAGYQAGAAWADPSVQVLSAYAGVTPEAFKDPAKGRELALAQIDRGADVIYHASGATGLGVFEAVRERRVLGVGVDSDQSGDAPGRVLTSITKNVDEAVFRAVKAAKDGKPLSGVSELGLKEGGVGYVYDARNKGLLSPAARAKAEEARGLIVAGKLRVPSR